jgi:hypothetical protein
VPSKKLTEEEPVGTVMLDGTPSPVITTAALWLAIWTVTPPAGAGALRSSVAVVG